MFVGLRILYFSIVDSLLPWLQNPSPEAPLQPMLTPSSSPDATLWRGVVVAGLRAHQSVLRADILEIERLQLLKTRRSVRLRSWC